MGSTSEADLGSNAAPMHKVMLTMWPEPRVLSRGGAARMTLSAPNTFVSN